MAGDCGNQDRLAVGVGPQQCGALGGAAPPAGRGEEEGELVLGEERVWRRGEAYLCRLEV